MTKDKRIKSCTDDRCERRLQNHFAYRASDNYCSVCGKPLVFVCKRCFTPIEDGGMDKIYCEACETALAEKGSNMRKMIKEIPGNAKGAAEIIGVATAVVKKVGKNEKILKAAKVAGEIARTVCNKGTKQ